MFLGPFDFTVKANLRYHVRRVENSNVKEGIHLYTMIFTDIFNEVAEFIGGLSGKSAAMG